MNAVRFQPARAAARTADLLLRSLGFNGYIADSYDGLCRAVTRPCLSAALFGQDRLIRLRIETQAVRRQSRTVEFESASQILNHPAAFNRQIAMYLAHRVGELEHDPDRQIL